MSVSVIPYEPAHAFMILDRNVREQDLQLSKFPDWEKWANGWAEHGPAYTLFIDDEIVCSAGVVLLDWKRGEAWLLLTESFYRHVKTAYRLIQEVLGMIVKNEGLRRVQALIDPVSDKNKRFIEHLGFEQEGLMHSFGPNGEDMLMYWRKG